MKLLLEVRELFGRWLLLSQDKCLIIKWLTKNQKLCHFMEPYHAPYTFGQRYWTGLLLFVRVILYVISAVNLTGDPQVSLISTVILVGGLLLLKAILGKHIYQERPVDVIEMIMYFNIVSFAAVTLKTGSTKEQTIVAYTSVLITIICLLVVILFHLYRYSGLLSVMKKTKVFIIWINNYRKNRRFGGARLPDEEDDLALITHTVVELPQRDAEFWSWIPPLWKEMVTRSRSVLALCLMTLTSQLVLINKLMKMISIEVNEVEMDL